MTRNKQTTQSFEAPIPPVDKNNGESGGVANYDRTRLSSTPLAQLVGSTHMVYGVQNVLHGFDDKLEMQLSKFDGPYCELLAQRTYFKANMSGLVDQTKAVAMLKDLEARLRAERLKILPDITFILVDAYREAFAFLIDHLDDRRLEELRMDISQHTIAQVLYDNMDSYEDRYALGKDIRLQVLKEVERRAVVRGAKILEDVLPGRILEGDGEALQKVMARGRRARSITFSGMGSDHPDTPLTIPIGTSTRMHPETLIPPAFIPKSEEEIRAGVEVEKSKGANLQSPAAGVPATMPTVRRETLRYDGRIPADPLMPPGVSPVMDASFQEAMDNSKRLSGEIPSASSHRIPDLQNLFTPLDGLEDVDIQKFIDTTTEEVHGDVRATALQTIDEGPEIIINENAPGLVNLFEGFEDEDATDPNIEGVAKTVGPRPIPASIGMDNEKGLPSVVVKESIRPVALEAAPEIMLASVDVDVEVPQPLAAPRLETISEPLRTLYSEDDSNEEITAKTKIPFIEPWYKRAASKVSEKVSAAWDWTKKNATAAKDWTTTTAKKAYNFAGEKLRAGYDWVAGKARRHWKGAVLAGSLVTGAALLNGVSQKSVQTEEKPVASAQSIATSAPSTSNLLSVAPTASVQQNQPNLVNPAPNVVDPTVTPAPTVESKARTTFAKVIMDSKSPLVQDMINRGEFKLGMSTITDSMIDSYAGLANGEQLEQLHELQKYVNLGLGVYFNEHFGTPAKVAAAMRDPQMRNLYRTAKVAKEKGWFQSYHTKERFPKAYAFAKQMLEDSSELGMDDSDNPSQAVKDFVKGNMFQAKLPGATVHVRKADGTYHVVQEMVFEIFDGKHVTDMLDEKFGTAKAPAGSGIQQNPTGPQNGTPTLNPGNQPKVTPDAGKTGMNGFHNNIAPNKIDPAQQQFEMDMLDQIMNQAQGKTAVTKPVVTKKVHAVSTEQQQAEIDMLDQIMATSDKLAIEKSALEKKQQKLEMDMLEQIMNQAQGKTAVTKPIVEKKVVPVSAEQEKAEMDILDQIMATSDKLANEKSALAKTRRLEFDLPLQFTTREENDAIIPAVADKIASMHPLANQALVRKMIRQWGFIGFKLMSRERGHFVVELNPNFHKNILKPLLDKKVKVA